MSDEIKNIKITLPPSGKMSGRPPAPAGEKLGLDDWIIAAGKVPGAEVIPAAASPKYPWEAPGVRADVKKTILLPLTEPYMLKLTYVAQYKNSSKQRLIREMVERSLDMMLDDIV